MKHHGQIAIIILLKLNKMISASQRPYLEITRLQLSQKLGILLIFFHLLKGHIQGIARHYGLMMTKAHWNIAHNISDNRLQQAPVSGHYPADILHLNVRFRISHATADINAHRIGNHHILRRNHTADWHPHPGMRIRHQAHPLM